MLKGIPPIISPDLIKILMEMGHGDEIVLADCNFPAASHTSRVVRCDGHGLPDLLKAVLSLMPLDTYTDSPIALMSVVPGDLAETTIWHKYRCIIDQETTSPIDYLERYAFYERAKKAYAIVATGERALYANIILKKGIFV
ncbi:fucose isomerase [Paenibacillus swuensis]|uniref:Fucose isomerase n=1 Tax=Paenibacillus swuensis TaxID=1178515 RepID=A0A172TNG7_9BACL|nr:L-fucose mutarotase [Paenibacillus swuensis]ANE48526.1 fucose isomerase [Paenibacillus swuensis]